MTEIITYRLSGTGRWGYEFYDAGRNRIGSVCDVIATYLPVLIEGGYIYWYSQSNIGSMIVPGISRHVEENMTELEIFQMLFWLPRIIRSPDERDL